MKIASAGLVVSVVLATAGAASAQTAEAETLFREGKRLMKKGEVAEACEKFDASERLEPSLGTELNLADCREKNGQLASAWAMFVKAATAAKRADDSKRETEARRRADALESQLVYLTIEVPDDHRVDGLVIKRNDAPIDAALWNQRVPIDAARYTISAEAPGYRPWSDTVTVKAKNKTIEVPTLDKEEKKPRHHKAERAKEPEEDDDGSEPPPGAHRRFTGLAITLGLVGVGAIGTGIGFGLEASDLERQSDALCPATSCADPHGVDLNKQARRDGLIANIGFIAGGAALLGAVTLLVVGAPGDAKQVAVVPAVSLDRVGIAFGGRF